ncbi:MAG: PAS domain-containing protein [Sphingomonas sp.]|nr:PAS domain-containing protein [Sphingomonas sp.]
MADTTKALKRGASGGAGAAGIAPLVTGFDFAGILAVADAMPMPIAYLDEERRYRFINKAFAEFFERPRSTILGITVEELLGEDVYAVRKPLFDAAYAGERQWFAAEYPHATRGPLAIQAEYIPQFSPDGKVRSIVALVLDVTEQRVAERALRESEERFRRIANQAPVLMWVTKLDRTRDFVNDAYVEFVGGTREEARTIDWRERIHPDDHDRIVAESVAGEASRQTFTLEGRYRNGQGEYRWLKSTSSPRFGPDGELAGFIGAGTDITVAKEAELDLKRQVEERTAELARREAQFRAVFEAALEVMVLLEPDGTVLAVNNRREIWRHPSPEQAIGMKLWDAPTLQNYPQHVAIMKKGIARAAKGKIFATEVRMEREGLATAILDVSVQPVKDGDGEIMYLLFEARDITELKAAQEQLRQSQKMEALGQLTGGIAHDFNNLLTVVVGGLDLLNKRIEDEKLKRYAGNALTAAERGARLTAQLLAFSRVQRLEVRATHIAPLIENMRPLLRNVLGPGIEKKFDLDEEMVPVLADPTQVEVAVLNLAINARDAMPAGGMLTFVTRKVEVGRADPDLDEGEYIELCISDTGAGMTRDVAERAFEPFFTTKEVGKGTGLGLSMVYGMARQSGGVARIESEPGKGTTVSLFFRAAGHQGEHAAAGDAEDHGGQSEPMAERILVIDDDPDVRAFISESLAEQGYRVHEAPDGKTGLSAFVAQSPDLVVLDFIMPGLSGADVASRILSTHPDQPILFVSGYSETDSIKRIAPDAPLLTKPFRAEALNKAVRTALAKA